MTYLLALEIGASMWPPESNSDCTLQWVRASAEEQRPGLSDATSGLSPASAPSRLLLRRPTPVLWRVGL